MSNINQEIYEEISAKGDLQKLIARVRSFRPSASRNTIILAFRPAKRPTALRKKIVEIGKELLTSANEAAKEQTPIEMAMHSNEVLPS